jgi:hypothetical protein
MSTEGWLYIGVGDTRYGVLDVLANYDVIVLFREDDRLLMHRTPDVLEEGEALILYRQDNEVCFDRGRVEEVHEDGALSFVPEAEAPPEEEA